MKRRLITFISAALITMGLAAQQRTDAPVLRYEENKSLSWEEAIAFYSDLDKKYSEATLM